MADGAGPRREERISRQPLLGRVTGACYLLRGTLLITGQKDSETSTAHTPANEKRNWEGDKTARERRITQLDHWGGLLFTI